jgi:monoamine oxidase
MLGVAIGQLRQRSELRQILGGMDRLPKSFVVIAEPHENDVARPRCRHLRPDLKRCVRYNARVTELEKISRKVQLSWTNTVTGVKDEGRFDRVIIAIPFSALRRVIVSPGLVGDEKRRSVRQLNYQNSCKIILELSSKFWTEGAFQRKQIAGGSAITDLPIRQCYYPGPEQFSREPHRSLLLASYTWGQDSLRWTAYNRHDRISFALRDVLELHELDDGYAKICVGGMSHSWAEDDFTSGAFAFFEPYQYTDMFAAIRSAEKLLHFCGEHTSLKHGWIEGAVESGIRVAREICEQRNLQPS